MRTTGLAFSALLVAAGAVLAWAVTYDADGVDLHRVGLILFAVGLATGVLSLLLAATGRRTVIERDRESVVGGRPVVERELDVINERDGR